MPNLYVSLSQIKDPGNLNLTETTYDAMLLMWGESVSRDIDNEVKRYFYCLETALTFNGSGRILNLPIDLLSISAFALDDGSQNYLTTLASTDYILNPTYALKGFDVGPYTYIVPTLNSSIGNFASNIPAGVRITGTWGYGTGLTPTPYVAIGDTVQDNPLTANATTLTVATGILFSPGQTLRIGSEQVYISAVSGNSITIQRAMNGTTAAAHVQTTAIYIYQYHPVVVACCLVQIGIWWNRRKNSFAAVEGNPEMGTIQIYKGLDPMVKQMLHNGKLYRHAVG